MKLNNIALALLCSTIAAVPGTGAAQSLVTRADCPAPGIWAQTGLQGRIPVGTCSGLSEAATPAPIVCSEPPTVEAQSTSPASILVKSGAIVTISVTGAVTNAEGCTLKTTEYRLDDEYTEISGVAKVNVNADGQFVFSVPVEASRKGNDADGRTYTIVVSASNEAGSALSAPIVSTVAHDNRESK